MSKSQTIRYTPIKIIEEFMNTNYEETGQKKTSLIEYVMLKHIENSRNGVYVPVKKEPKEVRNEDNILLMPMRFGSPDIFNKNSEIKVGVRTLVYNKILEINRAKIAGGHNAFEDVDKKVMDGGLTEMTFGNMKEVEFTDDNMVFLMEQQRRFQTNIQHVMYLLFRPYQTQPNIIALMGR